MIYRILGPGEALEGSLVWLGAQPGARIHKAAKAEEQHVNEEELKALREKVAALQASVDAGKAAVEALDALKAAAGGAAGDVKALSQAVSDGLQYRKHLIEDLVALERVAGMVGDDEAAVVSAKALYAGADLATLKARRDALATKHAAPGRMAGSNPNTTGAGAPPSAAGDKADPFDPFSNPAIAG